MPFERAFDQTRRGEIRQPLRTRAYRGHGAAFVRGTPHSQPEHPGDVVRVPIAESSGIDVEQPRDEALDEALDEASGDTLDGAAGEMTPASVIHDAPPNRLSSRRAAPA